MNHKQNNAEIRKPNANLGSLVLNHAFYIENVKGDGNCMFTSICKILSKKKMYECSIEQLRQVVARRFLDKQDEQANDVLVSWFVLTNNYVKEKKTSKLAPTSLDEQQWQDYFHILSIPGYSSVNTLDDITDVMRIQIYKEILKPSFWGETFSLLTLSQYFNMIFRVVDGSKLKYTGVTPKEHITYQEDSDFRYIQPFLLFNEARPVATPLTTPPIGWLYLKYKHYQPLFPFEN